MGYPSDVSDREWAEIERFFEPEHIGRPRKHPVRSLYNVIRYVERSGRPWRMLPKDFPPWRAVSMTFWRLRNAGTWVAIHHHLRCQVRIKAGRDPDPTVAIMDSQSVKTVQKGGNAATMPASGSKAASATSPLTRQATS
ncbi:transposase [Candidatus Competibacter phosphatis]|uniref:Transposase n=1 Tax=Candidatus Competibacter phosphatis TaxID=221280 RepID=A0ABX1TIF4_9GAMM|nr:transposase [Candidatus Competibacter phosphatis]NMQ19163.1 transposase [Candidatus Competibacter phosphatis]